MSTSVLPFFTATVAVLVCVGCATAVAPIDPLPFGACACQDAAGAATVGSTCPTSVCDLQVEVDPESCGSKVALVEILIGGQLEPNIWKPGDKTRTCATIPRGGTGQFIARADTAWQWREAITCPAPDGATEKNGPTIVRVLHCTSEP